MSLHHLFVVFALMSGALCAFVRRTSDCPQEYKNISSQHTMCLTDVGTPLALTQGQKNAFLEQHNSIRSSVVPAAADMLKLVWDEDLAAVAAKWAAQCSRGHDTIRSLPKLPGVWLGQNMAAGYVDLEHAIEAWAAEKNAFHYGGGFKVGDTGHYTQMVNGQTALVGCGVADCSVRYLGKVLVCNYAMAQEWSAVSTPYGRGSSPCQACPDTCDDTGRLCDCQGKVCFNGGSLDVSTCQCRCSGSFTGETCQNDCSSGAPACSPSKIVF